MPEEFMIHDMTCMDKAMVDE
jgi:hypothetical protein